MATNQIVVNVYQLDKNENQLPQAFSFPATGFNTIPALDSANSKTFIRTSGGVDCYSLIERSGHQYLVKETVTTLQSLTNA